MILRGVQGEDLEVFFSQQSDSLAVEMAESPSREREGFLAQWSPTELGITSGTVQAIALDDGSVAGYVTSWAQAEQRFVGYWLGREYWGQGVATAALALFLKIDLVRPLHAIVSPRNAGSIRVLQKCGFGKVTVPGGLGDDADGLLFRLRARRPGAVIP